MTVSAVYLVYVLADRIAQLGMMMNIVKYKLIIFSLSEIFCFGLISVDLMTSESMTIDVMSNSPLKKKVLSLFF